MQRLQVTNEAHTSRNEWPQEAMNVTSPQRRDQEKPSASSGEVAEAGTDIQGEAWTVTVPPATAILNLTNSDTNLRRATTSRKWNYCEEEVIPPFDDM